MEGMCSHGSLVGKLMNRMTECVVFHLTKNRMRNRMKKSPLSEKGKGLPE